MCNVRTVGKNVIEVFFKRLIATFVEKRKLHSHVKIDGVNDNFKIKYVYESNRKCVIAYSVIHELFECMKDKSTINDSN